MRTDNVGASAMVEDTTYFMRFYNAGSQTFDRIACRTAGTFSGTATVRLGIYNNGTDGMPSTVKFDAGTVACTGTNTIFAITISETLAEGWYWTAFNVQTLAATTNFTGGRQMVSAPFLIRSDGQDLLGATMRETGVTGAFATVNTANLAYNGVVSGMVMLRAS